MASRSKTCNPIETNRNPLPFVRGKMMPKNVICRIGRFFMRYCQVNFYSFLSAWGSKWDVISRWKTLQEIMLQHLSIGWIDIRFQWTISTFGWNEIVWNNDFYDLFQRRLQRYIWEVSCCFVAHQWGKLSKANLDKIILFLETTFIFKEFWYR